MALNIKNSSKLLTKDSRFCVLAYGFPKTGKTRLGGTLDALTQRTLNKRTLYIMSEAGEGGGIASIRDLGVDYINLRLGPQGYKEMEDALAELTVDTTYGGVVLDSSSALIDRVIKPVALTKPPRERDPGVLALRKEGVPAQTDYQTMGELMRTWINRLAALTTSEDPNKRKHLYITALTRVTTERKTGDVISWGPQLPGQLSEAVCGIVQTVVLVENDWVITTKNGKQVKVEEAVVKTKKPKHIIGDRMGLLPEIAPLNFDTLYKDYWEPVIK